MSRIIFLNVGVIKSETFPLLDKECALRIENLCLETRSHLVITNPPFDLKKMREELGRLGFLVYNDTDWRTDGLGPTEEDEVIRWLESRVGIESYVILRLIPKNTLGIPTNIGFQRSDFNRAYSILMNLPT